MCQTCGWKPGSVLRTLINLDPTKIPSVDRKGIGDRLKMSTRVFEFRTHAVGCHCFWERTWSQHLDDFSLPPRTDSHPIMMYGSTVGPRPKRRRTSQNGQAWKAIVRSSEPQGALGLFHPDCWNNWCDIMQLACKRDDRVSMGPPLHGIFTACKESPVVSSGLLKGLLFFFLRAWTRIVAQWTCWRVRKNQREESIYIVAALQPAPAGS